MHGFYISVGKQGSGKTLFMIKHLVDNHNKKIRVFSNISLFNIDYIPISFDINKEKYRFKNINGEEIEVIDILEMLDIDENYFDNSIMFLDEIHIYFDSLDFMKKNNRRLHTFFSQLRKRNILLLATTQYLLNVDIRIRRQLLAVFQMTQIKNSIFSVETNNIDGYYIEYVRSDVFDLKNYYNYYDTTEIVH